MNPAATESATGIPPLERSRVAPEVNPIGGGIVTDEQSADTSPGDGKTLGTKLSGVEMHAAREYAEAEAARHGQVPNLNRIDGAEGNHQPTFKDRVEGYAKIAAGKTFNNPAEVAYGKAKLEGDL